MKKLLGVAPSAATDAVTKAYVDGAVGSSDIVRRTDNSISGASFLSSTVNTATDKAISPNAVKTYVDSNTYQPGGTDVAVTDGGTGRSTSTTAYGLIAAGTTATGVQQTISPGSSGQFLKSAGASALASFATITKSDVGLGSVDNTADSAKNVDKVDGFNASSTPTANTIPVLDASAKLPSSAINISKSTDANGWTVYDYGSYKTYKKRLTFSQTIAGAASVSLSSTNLPTGISTLGTNFIDGSVTLSGTAFRLNWGFEMTTSSSAINITAGSIDAGSQAYTGFFDVTITSP